MEPVVGGGGSEILTGASGAEYEWSSEQILGSGGYGRQVFAGVGPSGVPVAVKRVPLRGFDTEKWLVDGRYAERELMVHAHLRERGVAHVLELLDEMLTESALFLVSPRAEFSLGAVSRAVGGRTDVSVPGDLLAADFVGDGLSHAQVRAVSVDLARGLVELVGAGVVHRDLKPDNAVLHEGRWKWCDLGTSRVLSEVTSSVTLREHGTVRFQAPEVSLGEVPSAASDVYSFGCTLFALATGRVLFDGSLDEVVRQHRTSEPDLSGVADERMRELLGWMLKKVPQGRIDAAGVLDWLLDEDGQAGGTGVNWGSLAAAASARERARLEAEGRVEARRRAGEAADALMDPLWAGFVRRVRRGVPTVVDHARNESRILTWDDRRLVLVVGSPADGTCSAVRLGTVIVEAEESHPRVEVANICAFPTDGGAVEWRLWRLERNDAAGSRKARVTESLSDGLGAVSHQVLEEMLRQRDSGETALSASVASDVELTDASLEALFGAELAAINEVLGAVDAEAAEAADLAMMREAVRTIAEERAVAIPIRSEGRDPVIVTYSDGSKWRFYRDHQAYVTAMRSGTVSLERTFHGTPNQLVSAWDRAQLEKWLEQHAG